jgi:hypothetical protein
MMTQRSTIDTCLGHSRFLSCLCRDIDSKGRNHWALEYNCSYHKRHLGSFTVLFLALYWEETGWYLHRHWFGCTSLECAVSERPHAFCSIMRGRIAPAGLVSVASSSDIMWAYLWEILIFHRIPNGLTWIGVLLVLASLVAIAVQKVGTKV